MDFVALHRGGKRRKVPKSRGGGGGEGRGSDDGPSTLDMNISK